MKNIIFALFMLLFIASCKTSQTKISTSDSNFKELISVMQGSYSSEKQAVKDTSYFNISLKMIPIWKNKGHFLYVEQALFKKQDKPYRIRIYKLSQINETEFVSEIYTLKNEKRWVGMWNNPAAFDTLNPNDTDIKKGCEVVLKRIASHKFVGQTGIKTCPSELRGASYATSKVSVFKNQIISWDQGFDKADKQVWGAEKAGYVFEKL